jgi:ATP-dependent DNA ligase
MNRVGNEELSRAFDLMRPGGPKRQLQTTNLLNRPRAAIIRRCSRASNPSRRSGYKLRLTIPSLFQVICQQDCEGIVGKYKRGTYTDKLASWVKVLNPSYSQMRAREAMFDRFRERGEHVVSAEGIGGPQ